MASTADHLLIFSEYVGQTHGFRKHINVFFISLERTGGNREYNSHTQYLRCKRKGSTNMTVEKKRQGPVYTGMTKHVDKEAGFAVWLPSDWRKIDMVEGRRGWVFTPYKDNFDTCITAEKITLDYKVKPEDIDLLVEGFEAGINSLPEAVIEHKNYDKGKRVILLEAKFLFEENGQRRKRWVKSMYWGEANLVLVAQGASEEDYAYWESMLYNAMMTYELQ
jgi:hypothetical protein